MNKIKMFISKHYLKIISLIFSIVLWFIAMNSNNTITTRKFIIPLTITNLESLKENNFILGNQEELENKNLEIIVRDELNALNQLSEIQNQITAKIDFRPIDLSKIKDEEMSNLTISVKYKLPEDFTLRSQIIRVSDQTVPVYLDKIETKEIKVTPKFKGDEAKGFLLSTPVITPETVKITGARSKIKLISRVSVDVNVDGAKEEIKVNGVPKIFDLDEIDITNEFSIDESLVNIVVPVFKTKRIPVEPPKWENYPAEGFELVKSYCKPDSIEIYGTPSEVDAIKSIDTGTFDIAGKSETFNIKIDVSKILKSDGSTLTLANVADYEVIATFVIEKVIQREIVIPVEQLTVNSGNNSVDYETKDISITIEGRESIINAIDVSSLRGILDVYNLSPGIHEINVNLTIPSESEGVRIVGEPPKVKLNIYSLNTQQESSAESTETVPAETTAQPTSTN